MDKLNLAIDFVAAGFIIQAAPELSPRFRTRLENFSIKALKVAEEMAEDGDRLKAEDMLETILTRNGF